MPGASPETVVEARLPFVMTPWPFTVVHVPVPIVGMLALIAAALAHIVWLEPATAVDGMESLVIFTVAVEAGQTPLLIFHSKAFNPTVKPLTDVEVDEGLAM